MALEVRKAADSERPTIERLLQLYLYDMASEHPWPLEPDGRYAYDFLDRFWQHPYLLYADGELAGFALVIRGCPITGRPDCWFMAEFFVPRSYRRNGLGREAAQRLLALYPGAWHIAALQSNIPALAFWARALAGNNPVTRPLDLDGDAWRLFAFDAGGGFTVAPRPLTIRPRRRITTSMPPATTPARNASLDALRVLSLLGIVTLHVAGGGFADNKPLGFVVDELSRFAVPVFFILSAYFWKDADLASPLRLTGKVAWRVLPAFAVILALTIALRLLEGGRLGFELSPAGLLLLLWSGGPAFHLWFLPALVLGSAVVAALVKLSGLRWALAIGLVLYAVGTIIGAYSKPLFGHGFPFWMDRNGLFFAPVFLVAGIVLRRHRAALAGLPIPAIIAALVIFAVLHLAEGYFVVGRYALGHDYSLSTLGYGLAVAILFMRIELTNPIWTTLGQAAFGAYLIHLLVLKVLASNFGLGRYSFLMITLGFSISLGLAVAWRAGRTAVEARVIRT